MFEYFVKKLSKDNRGFTLIELVVVIAILGILAAIAIPKMGGFTNSAKEAADKTTASNIKNAFALARANGEIEWAESPTEAEITISKGENGGVTVTVTDGVITNAEDIVNAAFPELELQSGKKIVITIDGEDGKIISELKK